MLLTSPIPWITTVAFEDKAFYQALGQRMARLRKEQGFTQQQLEQIGQLPKAKQRFVMEMLDTVIQQAS
jgi:hypothetical protein